MSLLIPLSEIVEDACHSMEDTALRNKMRFVRLASRIYEDDFKMGIIKDTERIFMDINPFNRTITLPECAASLSGLSYVDECGNQYPIYRSQALSNEIADIKAEKNCECECGGELCNLIKGYESVSEVVEEVSPYGNTETFTLQSRKGYDASGSLYEVKQFVVRRYTDGVWTSNEVETEKTELCRLELDDNGCVKDCESNIKSVYACMCPTESPESDLKVYSCTPIMNSLSVQCGVWFSRCAPGFANTYNITESGRRVIFPPEFPASRVLVRYYTNKKPAEIKIPSECRQAFITGLMYYNIENKPGMEAQKMAAVLADKYTRQRFAAIQELNKYRLSELRMAMTPPAQWRG